MVDFFCFCWIWGEIVTIDDSLYTFWPIGDGVIEQGIISSFVEWPFSSLAHILIQLSTEL